MSEQEARTLSDKFMLRLPDGLRDRIKAEADANKRSMNSEIIDRLERSLRATQMAFELNVNINLSESNVEEIGHKLDIVRSRLEEMTGHLPFAEPSKE